MSLHVIVLAVASALFALSVLLKPNAKTDSRHDPRLAFFAALAGDADVVVSQDNGWQPPTLTTRPPRRPATLMGSSGPNTRLVPLHWYVRIQVDELRSRGGCEVGPRFVDGVDTFDVERDIEGDLAQLFADPDVRARVTALIDGDTRFSISVIDGALSAMLYARSFDPVDAKQKLLRAAAVADALAAAALRPSTVAARATTTSTSASAALLRDAGAAGSSVGGASGAPVGVSLAVQR